MRKALILTSLVVIVLSILQRYWQPAVLFVALCPGNLVSLLITGGHGGTETEAFIAPIAQIAVNLVFYGLCVSFIVRRMQSRKVRSKAAPPQTSDR